MTLLLAPAGNMTFASMPSGSTYVSNQFGLIQITNGSVADQLALVAAGCKTLSPITGGATTFQTGTSYAVQATDQNDDVLFTSATAVAVTLPNDFPVGFIVELFQLGAGTVTASAASGGSFVTPNISSTPNQYASLFCIVISNSTGTNAQWNVIAAPLQNGGVVGAASLTSLYTQDGIAHYAQYTVAEVLNDGTTANNGTWLKTGAGNGSGNWTQENTLTLPGLNALVATNTTSNLALITALQQFANDVIFPDEITYAGGIFDSAQNPVFGILSVGGCVGLVEVSGDPLTDDVCYPDESTVLIGGDIGFADTNNTLLAAAPGLTGYTYQDFVGYLDSTGAQCVVNAAPADVPIAMPRGTIRGLGSYVWNSIIQWMDDGSATDGFTPLHEARKFNFGGASQVAAISGINKIVFVPMIGQSLSNGTSAGGVVTPTNVFNRAFMFNGGCLPYQGSNFEQPTGLILLLDSQLNSLVPLLEQVKGTQGETYGGGLSYWLGQGSNLESTSVMAFATLGVGGADCAQMLQVGTTDATSGTMFAGVIRSAERIAAWCKLNGLTLEIPCVLHDQGENDYTTLLSTYTTEVTELQSQLETSLKAVLTKVGQSPPSHIPLVFMLPSSWSAYTLTTAANVYEQLALAISTPAQFKVIGPQYYIGNYISDGVHMTDIGYRLDGEYAGRAVQKIRASAATEAVYVTSAASLGTALTITFNSGTQLVHDTSVVSDPNSQWGLRLIDTSNGNANVALSSLAISGANQVTATMASETAGHIYTLGVADYAYGTLPQHAGATTGPRAPIRDSATDVSSAAAGSRNMYNYACHQQINFTGA